jgi:hypothetical protein
VKECEVERSEQRVGGSTRRAVSPRAAADELFGSTALVDLLILLCTSPERRFYVNELIKLTGRFPRSIQLALARLEAAGVVRSERQANARFYWANVDHPFFPELRALVMKIPSVVDALRASLEKLPGVRVAFLRPEDAESTELELVVIGDQARGRIEEAVAAVEDQIGRKVRVECFAEDEWARQAKRERSFVRWLLEEERSYVIGGDADLPS